MTSKTIKISEENYKWLLNLAAELQKKKGERVSFDDTLEELKGKNEESIMDLAGAWEDISDKDWSQIKSSLNKRWEKWKIISA